jgi:hypothetical protein
MIYDDLEVAIETITHIVIGVNTHIILAFLNWNELYKVICKIDTFMPNKRTTEIDTKTTELLRETQQNYKYTSLFVIILGEVLLFCALFEVFILHFAENIVGVEHKQQGKLNAANLYETLLLEKYPFSCWTPFDEKSVIAHLAMYINAVIPVLMMALRGGSTASVLIGTLTYTSLQFKFVSKSLEELSTMEDSERQVEQNTFSSLDNQHMCEESIYRNSQVSVRDRESFQTSNQAQIPEICNKHKCRDTSITTAHCVMDEEHKKGSDRLPSGNKSSPEDCIKTIIKSHQAALW